MRGRPRAHITFLCRLMFLWALGFDLLLAQSPTQSSQIGYKSAADAEQQQGLLWAIATAEIHDRLYQSSWRIILGP